MTHKMKAISLLTASVAVAGILVAPTTLAHSKHAHSKAVPVSSVSNAKIEALESQLQVLQYELQVLRSQSASHATAPSAAESAKVQELDQWMNTVKAKHAEGHGKKDNMVFFRGGYAHADSLRGGTLDPTAAGGNSGGAINGAIGKQDAWYFGAGFDWSLADNLFGAMQGTEVMAELMFDYKELGERTANGLNPAKFGALGLNKQTATVNQLTLAASPKIKFFKGQAFRPWLIPVGFELSVISPPSDAITVLNPGMQFGLGADYKIWKNLFVGADARYHYSPDNIDGVNTNGVTAGGYVGIGF